MVQHYTEHIIFEGGGISLLVASSTGEHSLDADDGLWELACTLSCIASGKCKYSVTDQNLEFSLA